MKSHDFKLAAARPREVRPDVSFTEAVMQRTTKKQPKSNFIKLLNRSPAFAVLAAVAVVALASATTYAIVFLWPQLHTTISTPVPSESGRTSVIATDCDVVASSKRYELKKDAAVTNDKLADVVKAQCELNAVSAWATEAYPRSEPATQPDNTPGATYVRTFITPALFASQLVAIDGEKLTIKQSGDAAEAVFNLAPDAKVVTNGQYADKSKLEAGDAIAYVSEDTVTTKNQDNCTDAACNADIVSTSTVVRAVVKLAYPVNIYQAIGSLNEIETCAGNPADLCPATSSTDLYERLSEQPAQNEAASIVGKITSYNDTAITIVTSSGRTVTVGTPSNLIRTFNSVKSGELGFTIQSGDSLRVEYNHPTGTTNDTNIAWKQLVMVSLMMESTSKAGPYYKY